MNNISSPSHPLWSILRLTILMVVLTHAGKVWQSTTPNNVWEPGVFGWTEVTT